MDTVEYALKFEYKHLIVWTIWQYDPNNNIKSSVSYNDKLPALTLAVINGYSTVDD